MTLPPDPYAERWYFEHRIRSLSGYTLQQAAMNDLLWRIICERGVEGGLKFLEADQDAVVNTEASPDPCVNAGSPHARLYAGLYAEETSCILTRGVYRPAPSPAPGAYRVSPRPYCGLGVAFYRFLGVE